MYEKIYEKSRFQNSHLKSVQQCDKSKSKNQHFAEFSIRKGLFLPIVSILIQQKKKEQNFTKIFLIWFKSGEKPCKCP